ncbi:MAG: sigma-70 family RNA polymerase sigma factor [Clostridiales Family XIII bacterium]|nr:sigma-70 family RNA polymerase sigma factor [Clostridiales Family XIII bacterium]
MTGTDEKQIRRELVVKASGGDREAFEELYRGCTKTILYQAHRYIRNPDEADDAAQEAVIAMYQNIGTLKNPDAFIPWMYRLVKFVCLKHVRKLTAQKGGQETADIDDYAETLPDEKQDGNPERWTVERERSEIIMRAINLLPEKQREALILYYYEGLTYREIAEAIGSTTSTVSTNIMKAKKRILSEFEPAIALAISVDAGQKLSGVNLAAFHHSCQAGIAHVAAVGGGPGGTGAQHGNSSHSSHVSNVVAVAIAAAVILASALALAEPPVSAAPPPAPAPPVVSEPAPVYSPKAEITLEGGACDCGHVNPRTAVLVLSGMGDTVEDWELVSISGDEVVLSGGGMNVPIDPEALEEGRYLVRFMIENTSGQQAFAEREILIVHGEIPPGQYA